MDKTGRCHALAMACFFVLNHMSQFHSLKPVCQSELFGYVLKLLISTAGGRFHFITVQGRPLFKETTFTVSTLPRAWLELPCPGVGYAGVAASTRGLQALAAKAALSLPAPESGRFLAGLPHSTHCGVSRLMGLHYRSSHRRPFAVPAGQGRLRQRYIARRKSVCIFEESPPSVPINDAVLRIMNKLKRLWN